MDARRFRPRFMVYASEEADQRDNRQCLMCPTYLMKIVQYYCLGSCMKVARERGLYGNELRYLKLKETD